MLEIFVNLVCLKPVNVKDVDMPFTVNTNNYNGSVVSLVLKREGEVNRSVDIEAFSIIPPITPLFN